jgi:hypothetical protein
MSRVMNGKVLKWSAACSTGTLLVGRSRRRADVQDVTGGPVVGAVADVAGHACVAGDLDQRGDEAMPVPRAVGDRRDRDEDGTHAAIGEPGDRARNGGAGVGVDRRVALRVAGVRQADAHKGLARVGQHVPERLHDGHVGGHRAGEVSSGHGGMVGREVDDRVRVGRGPAQARQVA